jgi:hypothetical protein
MWKNKVKKKTRHRDVYIVFGDTVVESRQHVLNVQVGACPLLSAPAKLS